MPIDVNHSAAVAGLEPTTAPPFVISEQEVTTMLLKQNSRKAAGPDQVSAFTVKHCARQLSTVFTDIFNWSLTLCRVPACFKSAVVIPVPKKPNAVSMNDYRPVALTSVIMKVFERIVCKQLSNVEMDSYQFAYRANRSVEDAVSLCLHTILQHLQRPATYVRVLFIDFSSAFNTIVPTKLFDKLLALGINHSLCLWILDFLSNRRQVVKIGNMLSGTKTLNTGAPKAVFYQPFSLHSTPTILSPIPNLCLFFKYATLRMVTNQLTGLR